MQEWLINLSINHAFWVYFIIILTACVEGPILSMIFGVLIKLGYFSLLPIFLALMLGDLVGDTIWYFIGKHFGYRFVNKYGKYFSITRESIDKVTIIFHKHKRPILIISKITTGFGFAIVTLFTAGLVRIPFRHYIIMNLLGQFIWTGLLIGVGYFFSNLYIVFDNILARISIIALFLFIICAFLGYGKYIKKKMS